MAHASDGLSAARDQFVARSARRDAPGHLADAARSDEHYLVVIVTVAFLRGVFLWLVDLASARLIGQILKRLRH